MAETFNGLGPLANAAGHTLHRSISVPVERFSSPKIKVLATQDNTSRGVEKDNCLGASCSPPLYVRTPTPTPRPLALPRSTALSKSQLASPKPFARTSLLETPPAEDKRRWPLLCLFPSKPRAVDLCRRTRSKHVHCVRPFCRPMTEHTEKPHNRTQSAKPSFKSNVM